MWNFDPGGMEPSSNDLPLMANIKDIRVAHYLMDLKVSMKDRVFAGKVTLFLEMPPAVDEGNLGPGIGVSSMDSTSPSRSMTRSSNMNSVTDASSTNSTSPSRSMARSYNMNFVTDACSTDPSSLSRSMTRSYNMNIVTDASSTDSSCPSRSMARSSNMNSVTVPCMNSMTNTMSCDTDSAIAPLSTMANSKSPGTDGAMENSHNCFSCDSSEASKEFSQRDGQSTSKNDREPDSNFVVILDCCDIDVLSVEELMIPVCQEPSGTSSEPSGTSAEPTGTSAEPARTSAEPARTSAEPARTSADEQVIGIELGSSSSHQQKVSPDYTLSHSACRKEPSWTSTEMDDQTVGAGMSSLSRQQGDGRYSSNPQCSREPFNVKLHEHENDCRTNCNHDTTSNLHSIICEDVMSPEESVSSNQHRDGISDHGSETICSKEAPVGIHMSEDSYEMKCECGTASSALSNLLGFKPRDFALRRHRFLDCHRKGKGKRIHHNVEPWCVRIWKDGVKKASDFPAAIRIHYRTRPSGKSLTWAVDQDGSPCVFTQGAWINNRSLLPCQEPPGAMATWQAIIQAPKEWMVLMSGDKEGEVVHQENGLVSTLHYTDMAQPSSIVAIAVGKWTCHRVPVSTLENEVKLGTDGEPQGVFTPLLHRASSETNSAFSCNHDPWPCRIGAMDQPIIPSRIIAPPSLLASAVGEFATFLPRCLHAAFRLLGAHPFSRLDLLILPRCFASLGLASPSTIFLSQTLLSGDGSFLPRLAHEISHSWFGILIGARDWTEEWLSEGFATFMEDPIHAIAQKWTTKEYQDWSNLRGLLRYQALKAEVENTETELQIMRPMADQTGNTAPIREESLGDGVGFVKNGLNPDKWFLQVHYLKGYFLLHHLASRLSVDKMLSFIHLYVHRCHGQLVLSRDIFRLLFNEYPELRKRGITMETIYSDWLDKPGMPAGLCPEMFTRENQLVSAVRAEANRWKQRDEIHQKAKGRKKRRRIAAKQTSEITLSSDQLILLLEDLLDAETMTTRTLDELQVAYRLRERNAEVRHRWCELVVKHKHSAAYADIRHFLLEDQAMGVYLYGELMTSEDSDQQALARGCFQAVAMEMDRGCYRTVHEMLFGEPAEKPGCSVTTTNTVT